MRNQNIAKVLKEYRKRNHLSVNDVSILLEDRSFTAAPKTIYGWESGQANPSADILLTPVSYTHLFQLKNLRTWSCFQLLHSRQVRWRILQTLQQLLPQKRC